MTRGADSVVPTVHSAVEELRHHRVRFEVFARAGESEHLRRRSDGAWERRSSREVGVACRVAGGGLVGFAASSGSSARAGREAARAALATMLAGADPLPPRTALGCLPVPARRHPCSGEELAAAAHAFADALADRRSRVQLAELRAVEGVSTSLLTTGDGFSCQAEAGGGVVEALLAPAHGPLRHVHWAAASVRDLDARRLVAAVCEAAHARSRGASVHHQIADVVLAPAVAAPLLLAVVRAALTPGADAPRGPARRRGDPWQVVDERAGDRALLPLPCDGEGLPVRHIEVLAGGAVVGAWATWADSRRTGAPPGGSVRASYQDEPTAGPANLLLDGPRPRPHEELLHRLDRGYLLDFPDGEVLFDGRTFSLRAGALGIAGGKAAAAHPLVELRCSLRRFLASLEALGDDLAAFSLSCTVTTPSLLIRGAEIA